jgi:hypothetical protein
MQKTFYLYIKKNDIDKFDKWSELWRIDEIKEIKSDKSGFYKFKTLSKSIAEEIEKTFS